MTWDSITRSLIHSSDLSSLVFIKLFVLNNVLVSKPQKMRESITSPMFFLSVVYSVTRDLRYVRMLGSFIHAVLNASDSRVMLCFELVQEISGKYFVFCLTEDAWHTKNTSFNVLFYTQIRHILMSRFKFYINCATITRIIIFGYCG